MKLNLETQLYKNIPLRVIDRSDYKVRKAKRFIINGTNQNVWIPNKHLHNNGTIREEENLDYIFLRSKRQLELAGVEF
ncbi:hypothetical protein AB1L07_02365 [Niallia alba]|uniref:hypothetical protein n=1 Tax=Niallia alba TaxID=2729105 RepID=UPI0039A0069B